MRIIAAGLAIGLALFAAITLITLLRLSFAEASGHHGGFSLIVYTVLGALRRFLSPGGFTLIVILLALIYWLRRPKASEEIGGAELLARATLMERNGHVEAALASYRQIAAKYSDLPIGRDAQTAFETLLAKHEKKDA